jgi:gamma-glutamyltranspeptidase/glutathione hydrolase
MRNLELPGRSAILATNGMAATSHPLATITAVSVLQTGGNAMDAAVAACAVQCVVEPQSTGIGGDCFCLYAPRGREVLAFNGSGRAPMAATPEWYADRGIAEIAQQSPHAVSIPGAIDAWARLIADHGTRNLGTLLEPAIRYATDGFPVPQRCSYDWSLSEELLANDAHAQKRYLFGGKGPALGQIVKFPELAETLRRIAANGRDGFYAGPVAEDIVGYLRELGGLHTMEDFAAAEGEYVTPVRTRYRGHEVYECPPNGQGVVALQMLNILGAMQLGALDPNSAERHHLEIEASRLAYRDRDAALADPDRSDIPVEKWLSEVHAAECRALIRRDARMDPLPVSPFKPHEDTVYLTVVDKDRNAVSFINSLFHMFGSGQMAPKSGVMLQNRAQGFALDPAHPNCIAPGKRPMHTIIPGMLVKDGRAVMPFGVMGGDYQPCGHVHVLTNMFEWGMDPQEAIDQPRTFAIPGDAEGRVQCEDGVAPDARAELAALGHNLVHPLRPIGGAQAIWIDWEGGALHGASEPRKDGCAIGY